jgi:hypothetical protein
MTVENFLRCLCAQILAVPSDGDRYKTCEAITRALADTHGQHYACVLAILEYLSAVVAAVKNSGRDSETSVQVIHALTHVLYVAGQAGVACLLQTSVTEEVQ